MKMQPHADLPIIRQHLSHYTELGWQILLGKHASKTPIFQWKNTKPMSLRELLYEVNSYEARPGCVGQLPNFALVLDGLCSLDIDQHAGGPDGKAAFDALIATHGELPPTIQDSRNHLIFRPPPGFVFPKVTAALAPGLELFGGPTPEGRRHILWIPPSVHHSGAQYEWLPGRAPWEIEAATLPEWACELAIEQWSKSTKRDNSRSTLQGVDIDADVPTLVPRLPDSESDREWALWMLDRIAADLASTATGGRNARLNSAAFTLGGYTPHYLDVSEVADALRTAGASCGLDDAEIATVIPRTIHEGAGRTMFRQEREGYGSADRASVLEWPSPESLAAAAERNRVRAEERKAKARSLPLIPLRTSKLDPFAGLRGEPHPETPEEAATAAALSSRRYTFTYFDPIINADDGLGYLDLCPRYYQHAMYNHEELTLKICRHGCRCWKCEVCSIGLRRLYSPHFARLLTTQPTPGKPEIREKRTTPIYLTIIENPCKRSIEAFAARVTRRDGHYLAVVNEYGAAIARGLSTVRLPRSIPVSPEEAAAIAREDIYAIDTSTWGLAKCHPIYRSDAWALPKPKPSDNVDLGPVRKCEPETLAEAIVDEGYDPKRFRSPAQGIDLGYSFKIQQTDEARRDPAMAKYRMFDAAHRLIGRIEIRVDGDDPDAMNDFIYDRKRFPAPKAQMPNTIDPVATAGFGPLSVPLRTSTE